MCVCCLLLNPVLIACHASVDMRACVLAQAEADVAQAEAEEAAAAEAGDREDSEVYLFGAALG